MLDEATGDWGLRAMILTAQGSSDSDAIRADGKAAAIKRVAQAQAQAKIRRSQ